MAGGLGADGVQVEEREGVIARLLEGGVSCCRYYPLRSGDRISWWDDGDDVVALIDQIDVSRDEIDVVLACSTLCCWAVSSVSGDSRCRV